MEKDVWHSKRYRLELLKEEIAKDECIQITLNDQDKKFRKALLFCAILAGYSYLGLIITTTISYLQASGRHVFYLDGMLLAVGLIAGLVIYTVWKKSAFNVKRRYISSRSLLIYGINKLSAQLQFAGLFLSGYTLLLAASIVFVGLEIKDGIAELLKRSVPAAAVTYLLWLYLIFHLWKKLKVLKQTYNPGFDPINWLQKN